MAVGAVGTVVTVVSSDKNQATCPQKNHKTFFFLSSSSSFLPTYLPTYLPSYLTVVTVVKVMTVVPVVSSDKITQPFHKKNHSSSYFF